MHWKSLVVLAVLSACAARASNPVPISQPGDAQMTCEDLLAERLENRRKAAGLAGADQDVIAGNVAANVAGALIFWPTIFATDLSNAEQIEMRALQDRNRTLATIEKQKGCPSAD